MFSWDFLLTRQTGKELCCQVGKRCFCYCTVQQSISYTKGMGPPVIRLCGLRHNKIWGGSFKEIELSRLRYSWLRFGLASASYIGLGLHDRPVYCTQPANSQLIPQSMMKYLGLARLAYLSGVSWLIFWLKLPPLNKDKDDLCSIEDKQVSNSRFLCQFVLASTLLFSSSSSSLSSSLSSSVSVFSSS